MKYNIKDRRNPYLKTRPDRDEANNLVNMG
jgi:hypothetical protein